MKPLKANLFAGVCSSVLALFISVTAKADIPTPFLYFPLDGSLSPTVGNMPISGTATFADGMSGFGQCSTTSGDQLRGPDDLHEGMEPGTGNWTLSFWARFTKPLTANFRLFSKGGRDDNATGGPGFQYYFRTANTSSFFISRRTATGRERIDCNTLLTDAISDEWNHYAVVRDGATLRLYLNGEEKTSYTLAEGAEGDYGVGETTTNRNTQLSPESNVPGWGLDDVATWKEAFSIDQIKAIYDSGRSGKPIAMIAAGESIAAIQTVKDGLWENANTWNRTPIATAGATVFHEVVASSPMIPNTLFIDGGFLTAETGSTSAFLALNMKNDATFAVSGGSHYATNAILNNATLNLSGGDLAINSITVNGKSTLNLTGGTFDPEKVAVFGNTEGDDITINMDHATILRENGDGVDRVDFASVNATCRVVMVDSVVSVARHGGTDVGGIRFAAGANTYAVVTNINSVIDGVSDNGTRMYFSQGANAEAHYYQTGDDAVLRCAGNLYFGSDATSIVHYWQDAGMTDVSNLLYIGNATDTTAHFTLAGGVLKARGIVFPASGDVGLTLAGGTIRIPEDHEMHVVLGRGVNINLEAETVSAVDVVGEENYVNILPVFPFTGDGGLRKTGAGYLRMTAPYAGATVVDEGTLELHEPFLSSSVTVAEGAAIRLDGVELNGPLTLDGTLVIAPNAKGNALAVIRSLLVECGEHAAIAFADAGMLQTSQSYLFLVTADADLGALALAAECPAGWRVRQDGQSYYLEEINANLPAFTRPDVVVRLTRKIMEDQTDKDFLLQIGPFAGTGVTITNVPNNAQQGMVQCILFSGENTQAMHGPSVPTSLTGNNRWSCSMWVYATRRNGNEPTVLTWGLRKGSNKQNCSFNHGSAESRAASFFGCDPLFAEVQPAIEQWYHLAYSYEGATANQGLRVWVNGEEQTLKNANVNNLVIPDEGQTIMLGNPHETNPWQTVARPYFGAIGELVVFDEVLNDDEVKALFADGEEIYIGGKSLPDEGQIFDTLAYTHWLDAAGWRNGYVPLGNNPLVTGAGVSALADAACAPFKSLHVDNGATVTVQGIAFPISAHLTVSNSATFKMTDHATVTIPGFLNLQNKGRLEVTDSDLTVSGMVNPFCVGCDENTTCDAVLNNATLAVTDGDLKVGFHDAQKLATGGGRLIMTNSSVTIGSTLRSANGYIGRVAGDSMLEMVNSSITMPYLKDTDPAKFFAIGLGDVGVGGKAGLIMDHSILDLPYQELRIASDHGSANKMSMCCVDPCIVRNDSEITVAKTFNLGRQNAGYYNNNIVIQTPPTTMILDHSTLTLRHEANVAARCGAATLIVTNNAKVIKTGIYSFRIGHDSDAKSAAFEYQGGRVIVCDGGLVEMMWPTNSLQICSSNNDRGNFDLNEGGVAKVFAVIGGGSNGAFTFNGGTLVVKGSTNDLFQCTVPVIISAGKDAVIDVQNFNVTIKKALTGEGGLRKLGTGTLTLSGENENPGLTRVEAGTLAIANTGVVAGDILVESGTLTLADGSTVNGTVTVPEEGGHLTLGTAGHADTITVGAMNLARSLEIELFAGTEKVLEWVEVDGTMVEQEVEYPICGCDKLVFKTANAFTLASGYGFTLVCKDEDREACFADAQKYLLATAPAGSPTTMPVTNLPISWSVTAKTVDGTVEYWLEKRMGTTLIIH